MTWTTPAAYTSGSVLTAAMMNAISANLNETAPAKASAVGSFFIGAGTNSINERQFSASRANTAETTANTGYVELATTQQLTVTTSTLCLVIVSARIYNNTVDGIGLSTFVVNGASTIAGDDNKAVIQNSSTGNSRVRASAVTVLTAADGLNAGSNVLKQVFKVTTGTGTFASRELLLLPL